MARYRLTAFVNDKQPRFIVVWDLQWQVIESTRLEPASDLSGAMAAVVARLEADGWQAEATPECMDSYSSGVRLSAGCS